VKKINPHSVFRFIIIFLTLFSAVIASTKAPSNIILSFNKPIHLYHWQIAKGTNPKNLIKVFHLKIMKEALDICPAAT
jgi:hypothetical protein